MPRHRRISVSLPETLLKEFDSLSRTLGHTNRSKAIGEAMREFMSNRSWEADAKGRLPGVILLTYDHHARGITHAMTELQHDYPDVVTATMHIHLSKHTCLEVIAFNGDARRVKSLAKTLRGQNGVLELKLVTSVP